MNSERCKEFCTSTWGCTNDGRWCVEHMKPTDEIEDCSFLDGKEPKKKDLYELENQARKEMKIED